MSGQRRMMVTYLHPAMKRLLLEIDSSLATCHHFSGLTFECRNSRARQQDFNTDLPRLLTAVKNEESPIVILGHTDKYVPQTHITIARHLLSTPRVKVVVSTTRQELGFQVVNPKVIGVQPFAFTRLDFMPLEPAKTVQDAYTFWKFVIRSAWYVYNALPEKDRTPE